MAQLNIEQCLDALTRIIQQNNRPTSVRARIEKEIRFLETFKGDKGTLPSFASSVNKILIGYPEGERAAVFEIIYDTKIQGAAKNLMYNNPPTSWIQCLEKLRKHFRPTRDEMSITKDIGLLKVSSVLELDKKLKIFVDNISEFSTFSENGPTMTMIFNNMLVQKVKEIVAGALAFAIVNLYDINDIRDIISKFIGQDQGNLKMTVPYHQNNSGHFRQNYRPTNNSYQNNNSHNNSNRSGQRNSNTSGTFNYNNPNSQHNLDNRHNQNNVGNNNINNNRNNNNNNSNRSGQNRNNYSCNFRNTAEPMDTLSASYQREVNTLDDIKDFREGSPKADFPI